MDGESDCFLDGRYIALALRDVPEFIPVPVVIQLVLDKQGQLLSSSISSDFIQLREGLNVLRVVIRSSYMLHSALLWVDTELREAVYRDTIGEESNEVVDKIRKEVDELLRTYISTFTGYPLTIHRVVVPDVHLEGKCGQYGYCNAYVIKQVLDYKAGKIFSSVGILEFANQIKEKYRSQLDPRLPVEVEYFHSAGGGRGGGGWGRRGGGWGGGAGLGAGLGLGLLGGMAIGSLAAAPGYAAYPYPYPPPYYRGW